MEFYISHVKHPLDFYGHGTYGKSGEEKKFLKLEEIINNWCQTRKAHFHNVDNVVEGEIVFVKSRSSVHDELYCRGKILSKGSNSFLPIIKLAPFHINTRKENGEFFDNEANMFCIQLMPEYYTAHNIRAELIDYGVVEDDVTSVLKIDPSVKKFADIKPAKKCQRYSLAFVEASGDQWTEEANQLFKKFAVCPMVCLPTDDREKVTVIVRTGTSFNDLSEILIQAGLAKRISDFAQPSTSVTSISSEAAAILQPPLAFESRATQTADYDEPYSLSYTVGGCHDSAHIIHAVNEMLTNTELSREEKLAQLLSRSWPPLNSQQTGVLRHEIISDNLNRSDRELLIDILLSLHREEDETSLVDRTTQVTPSMNQLTCDDAATQASSVHSSKTSATTVHQTDKPSAPPISVTHYKTSTKSECANLSTGQQDGRYDDFQTSSDSDDLDDFNDWTAAAMFALAGVTSSSPKSSTYQAVSMKASNSPQYVQPKISSRGRGVSRSSPNTRVTSSGHGFSLKSSPSKPSPSKPASANAQADSSENFGKIMYCTYCGRTTHLSANCPDGSSSLLFDQ